MEEHTASGRHRALLGRREFASAFVAAGALGSVPGDVAAQQVTAGADAWTDQYGGDYNRRGIDVDGIVADVEEVGGYERPLAGDPAYDEALPTPAINEGVAYTPTPDGGVFAFDVGRGGLTWERTDFEWAPESIAVDGDRLYVGRPTGVTALDPATGERHWSVEDLPSVTSGLAASGGRCYVPTEEGVVALDADGEHRYDGPPAAATMRTYFTPAVDGDSVFILGHHEVGASTLVRIVRYEDTGQTLEEAWREELEYGDTGSLYPIAPVLHEGLVFRSDIVGITALTAAGGEVVWEYDRYNPESVAVRGDTLYSVHADGNRSFLAAVDVETGDERWATRIGDADHWWIAGSRIRVSASAGAVSVVADNYNTILPDPEGRLYAFSPDGERLWDVEMSYPGSAIVPVDGGRVVQNSLRSADPDGGQRHQRLRVLDGERAGVEPPSIELSDVRALAGAKRTHARGLDEDAQIDPGGAITRTLEPLFDGEIPLGTNDAERVGPVVDGFEEQAESVDGPPVAAHQGLERLLWGEQVIRQGYWAYRAAPEGDVADDDPVARQPADFELVDKTARLLLRLYSELQMGAVAVRAGSPNSQNLLLEQASEELTGTRTYVRDLAFASGNALQALMEDLLATIVAGIREELDVPEGETPDVPATFSELLGSAAEDLDLAFVVLFYQQMARDSIDSLASAFGPDSDPPAGGYDTGHVGAAIARYHAIERIRTVATDADEAMARSLENLDYMDLGTTMESALDPREEPDPEQAIGLAQPVYANLYQLLDIIAAGTGAFAGITAMRDVEAYADVGVDGVIRGEPRPVTEDD